MKPEDLTGKRILLSPLNWGMGHTARCIHLVAQLQRQNNVIYIACDSTQQAIFEVYFQDIHYIDHAAYPFSFKGKGNFEKDLLQRFIPLYKRFQKEKKETDRFVKELAIDCVISDHRYGFRTKRCTSIFLTHQLNLPLTWPLKWMDKGHKKLLSNFDFIWVADTIQSMFAGKLSENKTFSNLHYIGALSRFSLYKEEEKVIPLLVIVNGPEPYARQFFKQQFELASARTDQTVFIVPAHYPTKTKVEEVEIHPSINWRNTDALILKANKIISRCGYSTLMDLHYLKCDSELIPTPGQKEQLFLWKERSKLKF